MALEDKDKTKFVIEWGGVFVTATTGMMFGLKNALATFQLMI